MTHQELHPPSGSIDQLDEYTIRYSNWGRWGRGDECGTANLITRTHVRDAARAVSTGQVISLGLKFGADGPMTGANGRFNCLRYSSATGTDYTLGQQLWSGKPFPREMGYSDDVAILPLQSATHWDALSHIFHRGKMYNDVSAGQVSTSGTPCNGVEALTGRLVGRGVLLDIPAAKGLDWLEDGYPITVEDLEHALDCEAATLAEGDMLVLRTGQMARCRSRGWGTYAGGDAPGLSFSTLPWLYERGVSAVATDTWGVEVRPNELADSFQPLHIVAIVYMGLPLGEMFDLEALSVACAEASRFDFLLAASPLAFTGTAGAPPGPVAIL